MAKRSLEFILGFLGGIIGIALSVILVNPLMFISSLVGLIAVGFVKSHRRLSGAIMIASGATGILSAALGGPSGGNLLLVIAGIVALIRKSPKAQPSQLDQATVGQPPDISKKCHKCGNWLPAEAKFCNECGVKAASDRKPCDYCGAELLPDARFCKKCGKQTSPT